MFCFKNILQIEHVVMCECYKTCSLTYVGRKTKDLSVMPHVKHMQMKDFKFF